MTKNLSYFFEDNSSIHNPSSTSHNTSISDDINARLFSSDSEIIVKSVLHYSHKTHISHKSVPYSYPQLKIISGHFTQSGSHSRITIHSGCLVYSTESSDITYTTLNKGVIFDFIEGEGFTYTDSIQDITLPYVQLSFGLLTLTYDSHGLVDPSSQPELSAFPRAYFP